MIFNQEMLPNLSKEELFRGKFEHDGIVYTHVSEFIKGSSIEPCIVKKVKHQGFKVENLTLYSRPKFACDHELLVSGKDGVPILFVVPSNNEEEL